MRPSEAAEIIHPERGGHPLTEAGPVHSSPWWLKLSIFER